MQVHLQNAYITVKYQGDGFKVSVIRPELGTHTAVWSAFDSSAMLLCMFYILLRCNEYNNKSVQSNLGRGPRRGAAAHRRRKVPIGYNGAPQIRPQKHHFPWTDPQTPLPASYLLDPSDL